MIVYTCISMNKKNHEYYSFCFSLLIFVRYSSIQAKKVRLWCC